MNGIVSYGAYIPYYRLKKETAAEAFGKKAGKNFKKRLDKRQGKCYN